MGGGNVNGECEKMRAKRSKFFILVFFYVKIVYFGLISAHLHGGGERGQENILWGNLEMPRGPLYCGAITVRVE